MSDSNDLLLAAALVDRATAMFKSESRSQLGRMELTTISTTLNTALTKILACNVNNLLIVGNISAVADLMTESLTDADYKETDTEVKQMMFNKVDEARDLLLFECGRYYKDKEFEYTPKMDTILNKIVSACVDRGYYFGLEAET